MKDIRIFVASSRELEKERNYLAFLVLAKEDEFAARGLRVRLAKWEYVDPKMTEARTEDRYLDEMYNCDAALVLFRDIAGMYTREELDNALAAERTGLAPDSRKARLKAHRILFAADGDLESPAAKLRASLPNGSYGEWTDQAELGKSFLALVDQVAQCEGLIDAPEETLRTVSAFIAADDELAADRNAFADTIINLNDILARRGICVKMRFYDAARHREMLESSEMALVLYHTNCNAFGPGQMRDAYDRTKREENPKRLYVFFRDEDDAGLDKSFVDFKNGFAENLGHFFCRFENADTLKLNFLLSLENLLGEGESFVKLDGTKVKADELEVGELTSLPMVANNGGLNDLIARAEQAASEFEAQQEVCRANPSDDSAYVKLLSLSKRKNDLDGEVEMEMSRSFELAKRMAVVSAKEANETILKARSFLDEGKIGEAVELLDGASSEIDDVLGDIAGLEGLMEQKLKTLEAWIEVELFRADTVLAFAKEPFGSRFAKAEGIFKSLLAKAEKVLAKSRPLTLANVLLRFARLYEKVGNTLRPIPLLERALKLYQTAEGLGAEQNQSEIAGALNYLGVCCREQNRLDDAERAYAESLRIRRRQAEMAPGKFDHLVSQSLNNLGVIHLDLNRHEDSEDEFKASLLISRRLALANPKKYDEDVADGVNNLGNLHADMNRLADAEGEYKEALAIHRRLAETDPEQYGACVAGELNNLGLLHAGMNRLSDAEGEYKESLAICRRLAEANPERFDECVARGLNNLGLQHCGMNRCAEAEHEYQESLAVYRRLASANPEKFDECVARGLNNLGMLHAGMNRFAEAEHEYQESIAVYRRLAGTSPEKFDEYVANGLNNLGYLHYGMNRFAEAEHEYQESIAVYRRLAGTSPEKFDEYVANGLNNCGLLRHGMNRFAEAEHECLESLAVYRRLASANPEKFDECVARGLNNLASFHIDMNHLEEAEAESMESLATYRRLASENPAKYEEDVAMALFNIAKLHINTNKLSDAESECNESLAIFSRLAKTNPEKFDECVARGLNALGFLRFGMSRLAEAEHEYQEALAIYRRLAETNPNKFDEDVAMVFRNLGQLHGDRDQFEDAGIEYQEALAIYRRLAAANPDKFDESVACILIKLAGCHLIKGCPDDSARECAESLSIYRRLAARNPKRFDEDIAGAMYILGLLYKEMGRLDDAEPAFRDSFEIYRRLAMENPEKYAAAIADVEAALKECQR